MDAEKNKWLAWAKMIQERIDGLDRRLEAMERQQPDFPGGMPADLPAGPPPEPRPEPRPNSSGSRGFPRTRDGLVAAGYTEEGKSECRGCGMPIEWWRTPKGKPIPMDPGPNGPHWATCAKVEMFRKPHAAECEQGNG